MERSREQGRKGVNSGRPRRTGLDRTTPDACMTRWPRLVAHVMAESGYLSPLAAAQVVADANNDDRSDVAWVLQVAGGDALAVVRRAALKRHAHKGPRHPYSLMLDTVLVSLRKGVEQIAVVC